MILYGNHLSTYTAKVRIALTYKSISFEEREPPEGYKSERYREIVAMGSIPAIVDGDFVLSESDAIVEYLNETVATPGLLPSDPKMRAQARALSRIHDSWVEPRLRALYPWVRRLQTLDTHQQVTVEQTIADLIERLQRFERVLDPSPYAVGREISVGDCAWATTLVQLEMVLDKCQHPYRLSPELTQWQALLQQHPAFAPSIEYCRQAMTEWLSS